MKLLNAWESLMRSEQKAFELNIVAFNQSIRNSDNSHKIEILRFKVRQKYLMGKDSTQGELEELEFIIGALAILENKSNNKKS
jgi:hypothetical protein